MDRSVASAKAADLDVSQGFLVWFEESLKPGQRPGSRITGEDVKREA